MPARRRGVDACDQPPSCRAALAGVDGVDGVVNAAGIEDPWWPPRPNSGWRLWMSRHHGGTSMPCHGLARRRRVRGSPNGHRSVICAEVNHRPATTLRSVSGLRIPGSEAQTGGGPAPDATTEVRRAHAAPDADGPDADAHSRWRTGGQSADTSVLVARERAAGNNAGSGAGPRPTSLAPTCRRPALRKAPARTSLTACQAR